MALQRFTGLNTLLTMADVRRRVPVSRPTIYALIRGADFPKPTKVPGRGNKLFFEPAAVESWAKTHGYSA